MIDFPTNINEIQDKIKALYPVNYAKNRNFADGDVSLLSPYISRGVISSKSIYNHIKSLNLPWYKVEKFIQELTWRDYWQLVWKMKGDKIFSDIKSQQTPVKNHQIPKAIVHGKSGIYTIDQAIKSLYQTGYMHNHMRMYISSICCNIAQSHWGMPSQWMYAYLLDGDLASNTLSWQWVSGSNAKKKYYANQDNINTYFYGNQKDTFLDVTYDELKHISIPIILKDLMHFELVTSLPESTKLDLNPKKKTLIYNYYNLDPQWYINEKVQRVLLLEPSIFRKYPISKRCLSFFLELSKNIKDLKIYVGEFNELNNLVETNAIVYKEHPLNTHYKGNQESRDWLTSINEYSPSFFRFWKKCKKELRW